MLPFPIKICPVEIFTRATPGSSLVITIRISKNIQLNMNIIQLNMLISIWGGFDSNWYDLLSMTWNIKLFKSKICTISMKIILEMQLMQQLSISRPKTCFILFCGINLKWFLKSLHQLQCLTHSIHSAYMECDI